MRPDVARAFDRMEAAARADGVRLIVTSGYRSDAEQAELYARHPDPKWVAPPGKSLHRWGTELDLGPPSAYGWLARNAGRFHFIQRYRWEPWHYGYTLNPRSTPDPARGAGRPGDGRSAVPSFVPAAYAAPIARAASRWNVSAALLAAQLYAESGFNPFAVSPAGARGIAQFMPGTARAYGLRDPFDARRRDPGPGAPDARPAAPVRHRAARARRLQRGSRRGGRLRLHPALRRDARLRRAGAGLMGRAGEVAPGDDGPEVRLVS